MSFNNNESSNFSKANTDEKKGFINNIGKLSRKIVMGTAIIGSSMLGTEKATAQTTHNTQTEQSEHKSEKTKWADEVLSKAKADMKELSTIEDVESFETKMLQPYFAHIGMLSQGSEDQANYSLEEYKDLLKKVQDLESIFSQVEQKFHTNRKVDIQYFIDQLKFNSSYSNYQDRQNIKNYQHNH